jgi:hypothetical protein
MTTLLRELLKVRKGVVTNREWIRWRAVVGLAPGNLLAR